MIESDDMASDDAIEFAKANGELAIEIKTHEGWAVAYLPDPSPKAGSSDGIIVAMVGPGGNGTTGLIAKLKEVGAKWTPPTWSADVGVLEDLASESDENAVKLTPLIEIMSPERAVDGAHPTKARMEAHRAFRAKHSLLHNAQVELRITPDDFKFDEAESNREVVKRVLHDWMSDQGETRIESVHERPGELKWAIELAGFDAVEVAQPTPSMLADVRRHCYSEEREVALKLSDVASECEILPVPSDEVGHAIARTYLRRRSVAAIRDPKRSPQTKESILGR